MNIWESTVLTDKGTGLQSKLINGETLHITKVMTGAAKAPVVNLRQQTSVTDGGKQIALQPVRTEGDKMILPVFLDNADLEEGYDLWQVGIYAQDPEEGEILYCIAQASAAKHIPSTLESPGFSITWDFCFKTSNTCPFEVNIDSVGLVNIEQFQIHTGEISHLKSSIVNLDERLEHLNTLLYPVGIVLAFANGFDPNGCLQGRWERFAEGETLVGYKQGDPDFGAIQKHGGSRAMQVHNHGSSQISGFFTAMTGKNDGVSGIVSKGNDYGTMGSPAGPNVAQREFRINAAIGTNNAGTGTAGNLQPYVTVTYWKRTE